MNVDRDIVVVTMIGMMVNGFAMDVKVAITSGMESVRLLAQLGSFSIKAVAMVRF